ncbi:MAG TPA: universal stress protein [Desulfobacterales bacterium]|nr:universal stress protein [Desulfobacterales bacterium]
MKILAVVDGKPASVSALKTAMEFAERLRAELGVISIRSGTHAMEDPAPVGVDIPTGARPTMPPGIRNLMEAADVLVASGVLAPFKTIKLRDVPHGHLFFGLKANGERLPFCERFGGLIAELNEEIATHQYNLVVIAALRRGAFGRFAPMNVPRQMALDLHCSFLIVRGGTPASRFMVCADGSPSSRRIFTFLQKIQPAITGPVELICARRPDEPEADRAKAEHFLAQARAWLSRCGKSVRVLQPEGKKRFELILEAAGSDAVIVMGESHMHDVRRRTLGTLPLKVMARTDSSFLLVKQPTEPEPEMFEETFACE